MIGLQASCLTGNARVYCHLPLGLKLLGLIRICWDVIRHLRVLHCSAPESSHVHSKPSLCIQVRCATFMRSLLHRRRLKLDSVRSRIATAVLQCLSTDLGRTAVFAIIVIRCVGSLALLAEHGPLPASLTLPRLRHHAGVGLWELRLRLLCRVSQTLCQAQCETYV